MNPKTVRSTDDAVDIAIHHFGYRSGDKTVLLSHATGFHAYCYQPIAARLATDIAGTGNQRSINTIVGLDHRGHGYTAVPADWNIDWAAFGADVIAVVEHLGQPVTGFGHSMGASALILAARARPELFARLVLFEPIGWPASDERPTDIPIATAARKRRANFDSFEAAIDNYSKRPPLAWFDPSALQMYVEHGFKPRTDGSVELRCDREFEARTYETAVTNGVWNALADVVVPTMFISGRVEADQPSARIADMAERVPGSILVELSQHNHFGPMVHPDKIAELIERAITEL